MIRSAKRILIIGLGTQGVKRMNRLSNYSIQTVDPNIKSADFRHVDEVPLHTYDAAFVCTSDDAKADLIDYLVENGKHVLCEKPLILRSKSAYIQLQNKARQKEKFLYTAYNHRFEPGFVLLKSFVDSGNLGDIYRLDMFYGNGTARLVKESPWRDSGQGVIKDLGSHMIDTARFWFPHITNDFKLSEAIRFENSSPDYATLTNSTSTPSISLTATLCSWKNSFRCQLYTENTIIVLEGLVKWGVAKLELHSRVLPSGKPTTKLYTFPEGDPTWDIEHNFFFSAIENQTLTNLSNDLFIFEQLQRCTSDL